MRKYTPEGLARITASNRANGLSQRGKIRIVRDFNWLLRWINKDGPIPSHKPELGQCWQWLGKTHERGGYGYFQFGLRDVSGKSVITSWVAHRYSWFLNFGEIPEGLLVLHKCDNRLCCRPDHLWLGTALDNARDMINKERGLRGEKHPKNKISRSHARRIKEMLKSGLQPTAISQELKISRNIVANIKQGRAWAWLPM